MHPRGEPQLWAGAPPQYGPMELWRPVQVFDVELGCPACRRGKLVATGVVHEMGNLHNCTNCTSTWIVPGEKYPRRVERVDTIAQPLRGTSYAES
jgi:hypothetical protein